MGFLYVPILNKKSSSSSQGNLFSVTCGKQESAYTKSKFNGYSDASVSFLDKKLKGYFASETFSFKIMNEKESIPNQRPFKNFSELVSSISLGLFCAAYKVKKGRDFRKKYDSITVTGDFQAINGEVQLSEVTDIKEKYKAVQDYASKNANKKHLFLYVSSEEIIPDGIQENNVLVIRYDSSFPVECVFAEVFEDIKEDTSTPQKYRNEFIETRAFIKLKKDFIMDKSCNCHIIKGRSDTGKSVAAKALCKYLVNSQAINGYVWFYIGDNGKFLELLRKEKEERTNIAFDIGLEGKHGKRSCVKEAYPEVFGDFERLLQADRRCAIVIDNIEHDIVDEVLEFFSRNYPMGSNRYHLILTSWEGSRINRIESSIRTRTIDISDISLDFKELKAIAGSVLKINDYSKKYSEAPESSKNKLLKLLFRLCQSYPGYIPLVLSALKEYSMAETLKLYKEKDASDLSAIDKILIITFSTMDFLSRIVLFAYLQIKKFDDALKSSEIIDILIKNVFNSTSVIDDNDIRRSLNVLEQYTFLKERGVGLYEIKSAVLDFAVFSKNISNELQTARDLIITPVRKVEYAIEGKKIEEFKLYIDMISEKEALNKILIKLCKSDSSLEFFEALLAKGDVDVNYTSDYGTPLQICAKTTSDTRILDFLISKGADWKVRDNYEFTLLHYAAMNVDSTVLSHILEHHYYVDIDETENTGQTILHFVCAYSKDIKLIELLVKKGADWQSTDNYDRSLLHHAAMNDDSKMLMYILKHRYYSNINKVDIHGCTALLHACSASKSTKTIELLLRQGADKRAKENMGRSMLHCAAMNGDSTILRYILKHHYYDNDSINEVDSYNGFSPLHSACFFGGDLKSIELLLKRGADWQLRDNRGRTLLHNAVVNYRGNSAVAMYILEHHYYNDINETDNDGDTPLRLACGHSKDIKLIELLVKKGADWQARDNRGRSLLYNATENDCSTVLRYILEHRLYEDINKTDWNIRNRYGQTLLHYAAKSDDCIVLEHILEHHYYNDVNEIDNNGKTALLWACENNKNTKTIELLLDYGANWESRSNDGRTLLHFASANQSSTAVRYILKHHYYGDINEADKYKNTALHYACAKSKDIKTIELLMKKGADLKARGLSERTLLHFASMNEYSTILGYILEHHYYNDINEVDKSGNTALHYACKKNKNTTIIELLLKYKGDWNARNKYGKTILHFSTENDDRTVIMYILTHHYYDDINEVDNYGNTVLHYIGAKGMNTKTIEDLVKYGADWKLKDNEGRTMLHFAAENGRSIVLRYILDRHYYNDINEVDKCGNTALHHACRKTWSKEIIKLLLEYRANLDARTNKGQTLLHCAAWNEDSTVLRYILEHHLHGDINEEDNGGNTALFHAQTLDSFTLLLEHGANPNVVTNKGNNILHAVALFDRKEIVEYILKHLPMVSRTQKNLDGKTPADLAESDEIKKLLKQ